MLLINAVGKLWYGEKEWDRRKKGLNPIESTHVEPFHKHPLDKLVYDRQKERIMRDDRHS